MTAGQFKQIRQRLGYTQAKFAETLRLSRMTISRYEAGTWEIPLAVEMAMERLGASQLPLLGLVAAGAPIEPIPQTDVIDLLPPLHKGGETFALRVKGESMKDDGILPGDLVIVRKQGTAHNGQTVVALLNNDATIKKYYRTQGGIELHPANTTMQPIVVLPNDDLRIQGIVTAVIRHIES
ncbi:MAG: transcriptional repressor LexA [Nitrospira sp.]|nr:transcriptional repressor LexA [Nitrospira sp.]